MNSGSVQPKLHERPKTLTASSSSDCVFYLSIDVLKDHRWKNMDLIVEQIVSLPPYGIDD